MKRLAILALALLMLFSMMSVHAETVEEKPSETDMEETVETEAEEAIRYLSEQYADLLKETQRNYDLFADYTFEGHISRQYHIYGKAETDAETLVNYAYRYIQFAPDDDGNLRLIRVCDELGPAEKLGDYPLISEEEAYELLYQGYCLSSFNDAPSRDWEIADVQIAYANFHNYEYQIPYYSFLIDITGQNGMAAQNGLRTYGIYYVPAIEQEYYIWEDQAKTEQDSSAEDKSETVPSDPDEEMPEPTITPPEEIESAYIPVERFTQEKIWYCTVACVQMILNHFGIWKEQSVLAEEMNTYAPGERNDGISGTFDTDAARVLNDYLFHAQPIRDTDAGYRVQPLSSSYDADAESLFIRRMKKNADDGYPSILQIKVNSLYGGNTSENHNVLVTGYRNENGMVYLKILDPHYGDTGIFEFDEYTVYRSVIESVDPSYIW